MSVLLHVLARGGDETPVGVMVFFGILVALPLLVVSLSNRSERDERLRLLAVSLRGSVVPGSLVDPSSIRFQIRGLPASMTFFEARERRTILRVRFPQFADGRLRIVSDSVARTAGQGPVPTFTEVGDPIFDALHRVAAEPPSLVRRLFSPAHRADVIASVRRLGRRPGLELRLEPGWLELQLRESLQTTSDVQAVERAASEILGFATALGDAGMQWSEIVEDLSGHCPICQAGLAAPLVRCGRCRTLHHRECWQYLGRCATFGCDPRAGRRVA